MKDKYIESGRDGKIKVDRFIKCADDPGFLAISGNTVYLKRPDNTYRALNIKTKDILGSEEKDSGKS